MASRLWNLVRINRVALTGLAGAVVGVQLGDQLFDRMVPLQARPQPAYMRSYKERFLHFATIPSENPKIKFMTQRDFVRALLGASKRDHKNPHAPLHTNVSCADKLFNMIDTDKDGRLNTVDWEIFMVIANANLDRCKILFKMFDFDESGTVEREELEAVMKVLLADAGCEMEWLNWQKGLLRKLANATESDKGGCGYESFEKFVKSLHKAVDAIEFAQYDQNGNGKVNAPEFAHLVANSIIGTYLSPEVVTRLSNMKHNGSEELPLEYWQTFSRLMHNSSDLEEVIRLFTASGYPLKKEDFCRAVRTATGREVTPLEAEIVFHVFDRDGDGTLEYDEFMEVVKAQRVSGGVVRRRVSSGL